MDVKTKKALVKIVWYGLTTLAIGQLIKLERIAEEKIGQRIDDTFGPDELPK